jgi:hypothetical protein
VADELARLLSENGVAAQAGGPDTSSSKIHEDEMEVLFNKMAAEKDRIDAAGETAPAAAPAQQPPSKRPTKGSASACFVSKSS